MHFAKHLNNEIFIILGLFVLLYLLYLAKIIYVSFQLKPNFKYIIFKGAVRSVYFAFLLIAILGPTFGDTKKTINIAEKNILFAVDISRTMDCKDLQPNRLTISKLEIGKMIDSLATCKIGISYFAKQSYYLCPFTSDLDAAKTLVSTIHPYFLRDRGTDFESIIKLTLSKYLRKNYNTINALIIFTDGENIDQITNASLNELKNRGIMVFVVAVGTEKGAKIPKDNYYLKNEERKWMWSMVEKEKINSFNNQVNGQTYELSENINECSKLVKHLQNLEVTSDNQLIINTASDKYFYFVAFAFLLIIADVFITFKTFKL